MDRFDVMRLFVRIVERENFSVAARDLQIPRASVTRAIQQLEAQLGVRLLERTTRAVRATEDGTIYYRRCIQLLADLEEVESSFRDGEPQGPLCVDMQGTLARFFVLPAIPEFIDLHPSIALRLSETDRMVDLVAEGIDCVLRAGVLPSSALVGRQVASSEQLTLASPLYLRRFGVPATLEELGGHRMVAYIAAANGQPYAMDFVKGGAVREIMMPYDITVRGAELYTAAAIAGLGLIQVPRYRVEQALAEGALVTVLPQHPPPRLPISVLYPSSRHPPRRVRVFVDWLSGLFRTLQAKGRL
jgi:DNA-binding transcriptional LysR family regulator